MNLYSVLSQIAKASQLQWTKMIDAFQPGSFDNGIWQWRSMQPDQRYMSPALAVILNLFLPGLAQLLSGQPLKGFLYMLIYFSIMHLLPIRLVGMALGLIFSVETGMTFYWLEKGHDVRKFGFLC